MSFFAHRQKQGTPDGLGIDSARNIAMDRLGNRLGGREREVLEVLWHQGSATVQQVTRLLSAPLAYTTVMTTLDRLFKKGFVLREKQERAFLYSAAVSADDLEKNRAADFVHHFFADSSANQDILLSCFVDAIQHYDTALLQQLEKKIRATKAKMPNDISSQNTAKGGQP